MAVMGGSPPAGGGYSQSQRIRLEAFGEGWRLFTEQAGTWVLAGLVAGIVIAVFYFVVIALLFGSFLASAHAQTPAYPAMPGSYGGPGVSPLASMFSFGALAGGLLLMVFIQIVMAGLMRMAVNQVKGEAIGIGDMFSALDVAPAVVGVAIMVGIITMIGSYLCVIPGLIAGGLLMLALPLVVDHRAGAVEAVGLSFSTLKSEWLMAAVFYLVLTVIYVIGAILCGLGLLVTLPVAMLSIAVVYRDNFLGTVPAQPTMSYPAPPAGAAGPVAPTPAPAAPAPPPTAPPPPPAAPPDDQPAGGATDPGA